MCLSRSSRRVENSCQQCSTCSARVFTVVGSRPSRPNLRRSSTVKAVPLVVKTSNSLAWPRPSSDIEKPLLPNPGYGGHDPSNYIPSSSRWNSVKIESNRRQCRLRCLETRHSRRLGAAATYGRAVTITYDEPLRERFREHLASHD